MPLKTVLAWTASLPPIALTVLPMAKSTQWWIRLLDYPRLQIAAALAATAGLQAALLPRTAQHRALQAATLACLGWQLSRVQPYTRLHRRQVASAAQADPQHSICLMMANVLQGNRRAAEFLRCVAQVDPDIVLTVETDPWWDEQLAAGLQSRYPHAVRHPLSNTYGMLLFSKLELADVKLQDRVSKDVPSIFARVRLRSGQWVNLHCLHPEPPQVGNDVDERDAELLMVAREVERDRHPTIVCGDLNDVAWSHTTRLFQRVSGLLDPRVGRGLYPTFHAEHWFARWPLDHVFHDQSFRLQHLQVLPYYGSDHFPVCIRLVHDPAAVHEHDVPVADAKDREEAAQRIAQGREAAAENGHAPASAGRAGPAAAQALDSTVPSKRAAPVRISSSTA